MKSSQGRQGISSVGKVKKKKASTNEANSKSDNDTGPCIEKRNIIVSPEEKGTSKSMRKT